MQGKVFTASRDNVMDADGQRADDQNGLEEIDTGT